MSDDPVVRFAALTHDLGKGTTPPEEWPRHIAHEQRSAALIDALCTRLKIPNNYRELAVLVGRHHLVCHKILEVRDTTLLDLLETLDAFRRPARFAHFVTACEADARGRKGLEDREYPQADYLREARDLAASVSLSDTDRQGLEGPQIAALIRRERLAALRALKKK